MRQPFCNLNDRTVFFITHRLSSIRQANMIVMLHQGAVVEVGTHDELMSQRGRYYALLRQQGLPDEKNLHKVTAGLKQSCCNLVALSRDLKCRLDPGSPKSKLISTPTTSQSSNRVACG